MKLSIIVVLYNARNVIEVTLDAIYASKVNFDYEVLIIDNKSPDDSVQIVKEKYLSKPEIAAKTKLFFHDKNMGFGIGNNTGIENSTGEYVLLLNSDTKLSPENLQTMVDFMDSRPDVGGATCKLVKADGEIDAASRRGEPNLIRSFFRLFGFQKLFPQWFGGYNVLHKDPNVEAEIEACSGAYLIMPAKVVKQVGGFDPRFFMYAEDLDLCRKIREAGYKIWWYPKTTCVHFRGQSTKQSPQKMIYAFYATMWIYYKKWYSRKYFYILDPLVLVGVILLYLYKSFRNLLKPKHEQFVSKA
jgi:GT2 family glycosyltransferase